MKKSGVVLGLMVAVLWAGPANAEVVWVKYNGLNAYGTVTVSGAAGYSGTYYAGQMNVTIAGEPEYAFCIDMDHTISNGAGYWADVYPAPPVTPYCEMADIVDSYPVTGSYSARVLQVAFWKLLYGAGAFVVSPSTVNADANGLVAGASGKCPMGCEDVAMDLDLVPDHDGMIHVYVSIVQGPQAAPAVGEEVTLTAAGDSLVVETDAAGVAYAALPVTELPFVVEAAAQGRSLYVIEPTTANIQMLQTLTYGAPCTYTASATFDPTPLGDPRTIGFWKHQAKVATGGKGKAHVSADTLLSWLPMEVFGLTVDSLDGLYDALWLKKAPMWQRAQQQCLATMLNVAYGEIGWFTEIDMGDGPYWFFELYGEARDAYDAGDFEAAKTICDDINNL
jgi:hypothetical protein